MGKAFGEFKEDVRSIDQRLASLEQDARQQGLAMEADVPADKKTRERTEGAATAVQAKHKNSCSVSRVDPDAMCLTSFGDDPIRPPALSCSRDGTLVGNNAAAPKSGSDPWRCTHQQSPVTYSPPAQPLLRRGPPSTSHLFGSARPKR